MHLSATLHGGADKRTAPGLNQRESDHFGPCTTLRGSAIRSQVNDGPVTTYEAGQSFSELRGELPSRPRRGPTRAV